MAVIILEIQTNTEQLEGHQVFLELELQLFKLLAELVVQTAITQDLQTGLVELEE